MFKIIILLSTLLFNSSYCFSNENEESNYYKVLKLKGTAKIIRNKISRSILVKDVLQGGDQLVTSNKSVIVLKFSKNNSLIKLGSNTTFKLAKIVKSKEKSLDKSFSFKTRSFFLKYGRVIIEYNNDDKVHNRLEVVSKVASLGVRGTKFFVSSYPNNSLVAAIHNGVVIATNKQKSIGIPLIQNEAIFFNQNGTFKRLKSENIKGINWDFNTNESLVILPVNLSVNSHDKTKLGNDIQKLKLSKKGQELKLLCDKKSAKSCLSLAFIYMKNKKNGIYDNETLGAFDAACEYGENTGCSIALRARYEQTKDITFKNSLKNLCDESSDTYSCYQYWEILKTEGSSDEQKYNKKSLGLIHNVKNIDTTLEKFKKICMSSNDGISCFNFALLLDQTGKIEKAVEFYQKSCDKGVGSACSNLGYKYQQDGHLDKAKPLYQKGCYLDTVESCYNLSCIYSRTDNEKLASQYLELSLIQGFNNWAQIERDGDLKFFRKTKSYQRIKKKFKQ